MNCRQFDQHWNQRLDGDRPDAPAIERARVHAASCDRCAALAVGYGHLVRALDVGSPDLARSADPELSRLILERWTATEPARPIAARLRPVSRPWRLATAAALLLAVGGLARWATYRGATVATRPRPAAPTAPRPLESVLADAADATLSLARQTSDPAARLGRDALASAATAVPDLPPSKPLPGGPISGLTLKRLGNGVEARLRPLSGPTRSAFGFLVPGGTSSPPDPPLPRDGA